MLGPLIEPGYLVVEQEARWICEGIKRGWPLMNEEACKPALAERIRQSKIDYWTCPYRDLSGFEHPTMARIRAYAAWSEQMLPAIPHWFIFHGAKGLMTHEHPGL
ncbi:MAG: hypothetical protein AUG45_02925 [Ktedonobacter sp. 13_1_20CM_3_54_15]|nr:MAG: hypothetical protein AUG45_02925 [Ktedonobacter sp. 13_1_20CM_3_54_15]